MRKFQYLTQIVRKSIQPQANHSDITTYSHRILFDALLIFHAYFLFLLHMMQFKQPLVGR